MTSTLADGEIRVFWILNSPPREEGRLRRQPQADGAAGEVTRAEMFIGAATTPALRAAPPLEEGNLGRVDGPLHTKPALARVRR